MATRTRLNRDVVVETAEAMIDEHGWQYLTMTALAKRSGVQVPSLYNHVDNLEDLLREIQVRAHGELGRRMQRAAMGRIGPDALRSIAMAFHDFSVDHPGLYDLAMTEALDRPRVVEASEPSGAALAAVVASFGIENLTPELAMSCVATFHGVITLARTHLFGALDASASYETAIRLVVHLLQERGGEPTDG